MLLLISLADALPPFTGISFFFRLCSVDLHFALGYEFTGAPVPPRTAPPHTHTHTPTIRFDDSWGGGDGGNLHRHALRRTNRKNRHFFHFSNTQRFFFFVLSPYLIRGNQKCNYANALLFVILSVVGVVFVARVRVRDIFILNGAIISSKTGSQHI